MLIALAPLSSLARAHAWRAAAVFAVATHALACAGKPRGEALEVMVTSEIETTDPRFALDALSVRASRLVHAGLFRIDPDNLQPIAYAAQGAAWRSALELDVALRADVSFSSGEPLTAADVCATLRAVADPALGSRHRRVVENIAECTESAPNVVRIRLSREHATLLSDLELPILRAQDASRPASAFPNGDGLAGLGPYVQGTREPGAWHLLPRSKGTLPKPAHALVLRTIRDENARALRLRSGHADLATNGFSPTLLGALENLPTLEVTSKPGANLTYLLAGASVSVAERQRLSASIDRAEIVRSLFSGRARIATCLLPPASWASTECAPQPPRAAPVPHAPRELTLLSSTDRFRLTVAKFIAQESNAAGIPMRVVALDLGTLLARTTAGDFDLAILQLPEFTEPNVLKTFLHSSQAPPRGPNRGRYANAKLDELLDAAERTRDLAARRELYAQAQSILLEDLPWIPLWHEDQVVVSGPRSRGFQISAEGRLLDLARIP